KTGSPLTGDALAAFLDEVDKERASEEWAIERISEMLKEQSFNQYAWRRALEEDIKKGGILVGGTIVRTNDAFLSGESPDKQMVALASGLRSDLDAGLSEILRETGYKLDHVDNAGIQITSLNSQYKKDVAAELERGLAKWNEAEDKLRRAYQEWSAKNDANYDQGVRLWQDAFVQFETAHTAWQDKINQQIVEGDRMWDKAIDRLRQEQLRAQVELGQFMDEQSLNWADYFGTLNNDLYSATALSAEIQKNRRGFVDLIRGASGAQRVGGSSVDALHDFFGYTPYISLVGRISLTSGMSGYFSETKWDGYDRRNSVTVNNPPLTYIDHKYVYVPTGRNSGYWRLASQTPSEEMKRVYVFDKFWGDWREQYIWLTNYDYTSRGSFFEVAYDESKNSFNYHAWDNGLYQQWVYHQEKEPWVDGMVTLDIRTTDTEDHILSVDGGWKDSYDERYLSWYSGLNNLFFYQSQVGDLSTLGNQVADTQSRLFNEYSLLLNGTGASEGLFNPGADNQNFYFRTAKEWELSRLEKDLAEAQQNLARKENIRNLSMTPSWSASAQRDAEAEWKDAEQKYNDAKAAYEAKKLEADTYYANAVTTHLSNMAGLSTWLSTEGVQVSQANSNYFAAMDAYQDIVTNASSSDSQKDSALTAFRAAQDSYTNAKAGYEASNVVFKAMRSTKDDLMKVYYGLLGESDGLYASMISADHIHQLKRDSFDTIKYVDYLDTNETQNAYLAAQAAYDSLKTQIDAAAAAVSGANVYDFFGDSANAGLLATERYKLSELANWEGRAYQDLWNVDGNGFVGSGIRSFLGGRSRSFDIGSQTGDFVRDMGSYTSGGDKVTTQLVGLTGDTRFWSEDTWVSNLIEVAVKGNNIPLSQSRTIHNGDLVTQVTTRSNTFLGTVTAVTNQVALTGGDWNVSAKYTWDVNQMLRDTFNQMKSSFGNPAVQLMVEGVTNLGLKWDETKQSFLNSATNRIAGIKSELEANHSLLAQNVSNQIANGADERRLYGDLSKFYFDNMQSVNGIYGTGNAFGSAQGYLSDLIPTLVTKNKIGQYQAQMDAYSRQINSVMADRDSWQSLISKVQTKGEADWNRTFADMVSAFNSWNNRYAEDTYNAKLNWKAKNDDLNAHKYLWAQFATADITEGQRSAYFNELRSTLDAMIGDVFENMPKDVQGDTASLKNKDAALARMESLIRVELSQSLSHRGDSINTLFANTEVGKLYFVGNQELHARLEKNMEDTERIALNLRNSQMFESVAQSQRAREDAINGMNDSTAQGLEEQMKSQGYTRRGDKWYRRVVIDSSLAGDKYADQYVTTYRNHQHVDVPFTLTLQQILKEVPEVASYLIEKASKAITAKYEEYMGDEDDFEKDGKPKDGVYTSAKMFTWVGRAPDFYDGNEKYTVKVSKRFQATGGRNPTYTNGVADEERTRDPMEIKMAGSGEMNQLSIDIRANGIAANRGEQARNVPFYAKKLWDDD
ncbi:MAG: hypothetical protein JNM63_12890, partial [Spirochaetia bacterium]|nr:hypothetical protein [Spirochaetia bacterium]